MDLFCQEFCAKASKERQLMTQQEIPIVLLGQPQGNKEPRTGKSFRDTDLPCSTAAISHKVTLTIQEVIEKYC